MSKSKVTIIQDGPYILVGEIFNTPETIKIRDFFQFVVAGKNMSPLSAELDVRLTNADKDRIWEVLIKKVNATDDDFIFDLFLNNRIKEIEALKLSDTNLLIDRIKGFSQCKSNEHKLDSFFKRIRDALAHGRVYRQGKFLVFEDKNKQMTGRIVLTLQCMYDWNEILEQEISIIKGV